MPLRTPDGMLVPQERKRPAFAFGRISFGPEESSSEDDACSGRRPDSTSPPQPPQQLTPEGNSVQMQRPSIVLKNSRKGPDVNGSEDEIDVQRMARYRRLTADLDRRESSHPGISPSRSLTVGCTPTKGSRVDLKPTRSQPDDDQASRVTSGILSPAPSNGTPLSTFGSAASPDSISINDPRGTRDLRSSYGDGEGIRGNYPASVVSKRRAAELVKVTGVDAFALPSAKAACRDGDLPHCRRGRRSPATVTSRVDACSAVSQGHDVRKVTEGTISVTPRAYSRETPSVAHAGPRFQSEAADPAPGSGAHHSGRHRSVPFWNKSNDGSPKNGQEEMPCQSKSNLENITPSPFSAAAVSPSRRPSRDVSSNLEPTSRVPFCFQRPRSEAGCDFQNGPAAAQESYGVTSADHDGSNTLGRSANNTGSANNTAKSPIQSAGTDFLFDYGDPWLPAKRAKPRLGDLGSIDVKKESKADPCDVKEDDLSDESDGSFEIEAELARTKEEIPTESTKAARRAATDLGGRYEVGSVVGGPQDCGDDADLGSGLLSFSQPVNVGGGSSGPEGGWKLSARGKRWELEPRDKAGKTFSLPSKVYERMYPHQRVGVEWMWGLHQGNMGGILGDDMGLGKTFQVS